VRYGVLIGSATAVFLLVAGGAVVYRGDGTHRSDPPTPKEATAPQPEPTVAMAKPTEAERVAQPAAPVPPSFDVVKVGPTGTAVIAGRAEPGAKVIVRDGDKAIGEVTADRRGEWVLIPEQPIAAGNRVVLSGRAAPGATVQIYLGNEPLATVTADAAGAWSATSSRTVPSGQLELRLDQLTTSGQVAQRVALPFGQGTAMEPAPGQDYVVQRGNSLWRIARRAYGAGMRYVVIYSANPDRIRNPDKIYPGQVFKIPKS